MPAKQISNYERFIIIKDQRNSNCNNNKNNTFLFSIFLGCLFHVRQVKLWDSYFFIFRCLAFYQYSRCVSFNFWCWVVCSSVSWCACHISHSSMHWIKSSAFYFRSQTHVAHFEETVLVWKGFHSPHLNESRLLHNTYKYNTKLFFIQSNEMPVRIVYIRYQNNNQNLREWCDLSMSHIFPNWMQIQSEHPHQHQLNNDLLDLSHCFDAKMMIWRGFRCKL